jgi:hypothetical protein
MWLGSPWVAPWAAAQMAAWAHHGLRCEVQLCRGFPSQLLIREGEPLAYVVWMLELKQLALALAKRPPLNCTGKRRRDGVVRAGRESWLLRTMVKDEGRTVPLETKSCVLFSSLRSSAI